MKKTLTIIMTLVLVMSVGIVPCAALSYPTDTISAEQYHAKVKAEYSKYGIEYEVINNGSIEEVSTNMLEDELARVNNIGKQYLKEREIEKAEVELFKKNIDKGNNLDSINSDARGSMYYDKTFKASTNFKEVKGYGNATICIKVDTTCVGDSKEFISVNKISSYQLGLATNFYSWTETNTDYNLTRKFITAYAEGRLSFQYQEPFTGASVMSTTEREVILHVDPSSI